MSYAGWSFVPLGVGALAAVVGLEVAMWVLLAGPVAIFVGLGAIGTLSERLVGGG